MGWFKRMVRLEKPVRKVGWGRIAIRTHLYTNEKLFRKQMKKLLIHITKEELDATISRAKECNTIYALVDESLYNKVSKGRAYLFGLKVETETPGNCCSNGAFLTGDCSCGIHEDSDRLDYMIIATEHPDESGWKRGVYYCEQ